MSMEANGLNLTVKKESASELALHGVTGNDFALPPIAINVSSCPGDGPSLQQARCPQNPSAFPGNQGFIEESLVFDGEAL